MSTTVVYDTTTGTVIGSEGLVLVDITRLAEALGVSPEDAEEALSSEDSDAQFFAVEVGAALTF